MPRKGFGIYQPKPPVQQTPKSKDDKLYADAAEKRPEAENKDHIRAAGYSVGKVWRTFWPVEAMDETEVLFTGRWNGVGTKDSTRQGADSEDQAYTAYITPNRVVVGTGW